MIVTIEIGWKLFVLLLLLGFLTIVALIPTEDKKGRKKPRLPPSPSLN